jgi:hypothetical protein
MDSAIANGSVVLWSFVKICVKQLVDRHIQGSQEHFVSKALQKHLLCLQCDMYGQ